MSKSSASSPAAVSPAYLPADAVTISGVSSLAPKLSSIVSYLAQQQMGGCCWEQLVACPFRQPFGGRFRELFAAPPPLLSPPLLWLCWRPAGGW